MQSINQSINQSKSSVKMLIRLSSNYARVLLCAGTLLASLEAGAANIDCSTDLITGTFSGSYPGSL
jgi:hypothetical protein